MPLQFIEIRFPEKISYGSRGGPRFHNTIVTTASGYEYVNINWADARCEYDVSHAIRTKTQFDELLQFFRVVKGRATGFRYKDWLDFQATNMLLATNGTGGVQCAKQYTVSGNTYTRFLSKIVAGSYSGPGSVNNNTGIVTGASAGNTFSCEFDVPVRFDIDKMDTSIDNYDIYTWGQILLVELRV